MPGYESAIRYVGLTDAARDRTGNAGVIQIDASRFNRGFTKFNISLSLFERGLSIVIILLADGLFRKQSFISFKLQPANY